MSSEEMMKLENTMESLDREGEEAKPVHHHSVDEVDDKEEKGSSSPSDKEEKGSSSTPEKEEERRSSSSAKVSPLPADHPSHKEDQEEIARKAQTLRDLTKVMTILFTGSQQYCMCVYHFDCQQPARYY